MRIRFLAPKRWRFLVGPCGEGFARSNEGAFSSTGSAWVCCVVYTNSVRFQTHHEKKHIKITQRCDESSCQILKVVFNRMDIDIDSDVDSYNDNTPNWEDGNHSPPWNFWRPLWFWYVGANIIKYWIKIWHETFVTGEGDSGGALWLLWLLSRFGLGYACNLSWVVGCLCCV